MIIYDIIVPTFFMIKNVMLIIANNETLIRDKLCRVFFFFYGAYLAFIIQFKPQTRQKLYIKYRVLENPAKRVTDNWAILFIFCLFKIISEIKTFLNIL